MAEKQHKDLTGTDLHEPKAHASSHNAAGSDPLSLPFSELSDVPSYAGKGSLFAQVKPTEDGLQFVAVTSGGGGLPDAHASTHMAGGADPISTLPDQSADITVAKTTPRVKLDETTNEWCIALDSNVFKIQRWNGSSWDTIMSIPAAGYVPDPVPGGCLGSVSAYAGSSDPSTQADDSEWVLCDGRAISRTTYSALYALIGDTYGSGDGSTTFNIPTLKDRIPIGADTGRALGSQGGAWTHRHDLLQVPQHSHGVNDPGHEHKGRVAADKLTEGGTGGASDYWSGAEAASSGDGETVTTGISIQNAGTSGAVSEYESHEPKYTTLNYIIRIL